MNAVDTSAGSFPGPRLVLSLSTVITEDKDGVLASVALVVKGMEFADALHLCSRPNVQQTQGATFVSFDRKLVQRARRAEIANTEIAGEGTT